MRGQSLRAAGEQEKINHGLFAHPEDDIFFFFLAYLRPEEQS